MTTSLIRSLLPVLLFGATGTGFSQDSKAPFSIQISLPQSAVETASKLKIKVLVTNVSHSDIVCCTDNSRDALLSGFQVHAYNTQGRHLKMSPAAWGLTGKKAAKDDKNDYSDYAREYVAITGGGCLPLKPGEEDYYWLDLSEAYHLDQPGKYAVSVSREDPVSKVVVTSNTLTITVTGATK